MRDEARGADHAAGVASRSDRRTGVRSDVRIAVLTSNVGGHVQALLEHPIVGPWVALVVADRPEAFALRHARWHGVPTVALRAGRSYLDLYDLALLGVLRQHAIDHVVVAGFSRIVGTETVRAYQDRIVKVHHSLLPESPGPAPVADALAHGVGRTGVTVHLIDQQLEAGPIVSQQALEIRHGETWHSLVGRIQELELRLLPTAVHAFVEGVR